MDALSIGLWLVGLLGLAVAGMALEVGQSQGAQESATASAEGKAKKARGKRQRKGSRAHPIRGEKSARDIAIEFLKRHGGKAKFAVLMDAVKKGMGRDLSWTPTYYLKSPGFSKPERGIVAYSAKKEQSMRKEAGKAKEAAKKAKADKAAAKAAKKASRKAKPEEQPTAEEGGQ